MLVREAHEILLAGGDPGAEAYRLVSLGPAMAEPIEDLLGLAAIGADEHEEEFVAADTKGDVLLADRPADRVSEGDQDVIAGLVAVIVVVALELSRSISTTADPLACIDSWGPSVLRSSSWVSASVCAILRSSALCSSNWRNEPRRDLRDDDPHSRRGRHHGGQLGRENLTAADDERHDAEWDEGERAQRGQVRPT